jgi:hypothetical protein
VTPNRTAPNRVLSAVSSVCVANGEPDRTKLTSLAGLHLVVNQVCAIRDHNGRHGRNPNRGNTSRHACQRQPEADGEAFGVTRVLGLPDRIPHRVHDVATQRIEPQLSYSQGVADLDNSFRRAESRNCQY